MKLAGADDQIMMYHADKLHWLADTTLLDSLLDQLSAEVRFMYCALSAWTRVCLFLSFGLTPLTARGLSKQQTTRTCVSLRCDAARRGSNLSRLRFQPALTCHSHDRTCQRQQGLCSHHYA